MLFGVHGGDETKQSMVMGGSRDGVYSVVIPKPMNIVHSLTHAAVFGH